MRDLIERASRLSKSERKELVRAIKALDGSGLARMSERVSDEDMLLGVVAEVLRAKRVEFSSIAALRQSHDIATVRDKLPELMQFLSQAHNTRAGQHATLRLGVELLYDSLLRMNVPVSGRMLVNHLHRLPSIINEAFPGYAEAGLLSLLVKG